jgi:prolyl-tRNA synthetase
MLDVYADFAINEAAVPVVKGRKSESERFAGAVRTFSIEGMMKDTRALQSGTSHNLGQNFAKAFNIQYLDRNNILQHCWTTSWGLSTRFIGAIIMTHGDDQGLVFPPKLAPIQIVIIPIYRTEEERERVKEAAQQIAARLSSYRCKVDDREEITPGFKFNEWELRGVPLRIEIGPKDIDQQSVMTARRDIPGKEGKASIGMDQLEPRVAELLSSIQANLLVKATKFRESHTYEPNSFEGLKESVEKGWALSPWCGDPQCEAKVKEETKATTRCIPFNQEGFSGACVVCGQPASERVIFARAY